jgi:hypothetical protein
MASFIYIVTFFCGQIHKIFRIKRALARRILEVKEGIRGREGSKLEPLK